MKDENKFCPKCNTFTNHTVMTVDIYCFYKCLKCKIEHGSQYGFRFIRKEDKKIDKALLEFEKILINKDLAKEEKLLLKNTIKKERKARKEAEKLYKLLKEKGWNKDKVDKEIKEDYMDIAGMLNRLRYLKQEYCIEFSATDPFTNCERFRNQLLELKAGRPVWVS